VKGDASLTVELWVPTRDGRVDSRTASLIAPYSPNYLVEPYSVASARNEIVREFLSSDAQALVMVDDDVVPPAGFVEELHVTTKSTGERA
jgi:hypothetical protein